MMKKKSVLILICSLIFTLSSFAQTSVWGEGGMEWIMDNTGDNPGEKVVAVIDAGTLGTYTGVELVGMVIDNNGNWGYALPTVANFRLFVNFTSGFDYALEQSVRTNRIKLGLRKISDTKVHLVANCPYKHSAMRVILKKVEGSLNVSLGSGESSTTDELLISEPIYKSIFTGRMGLNTDSPDYELDVVGTIRAQELKVDMLGADFVFEEDYPLRPISELEDFVKTNKHLPEIAPAKEMQENGVNQSEMNQKLLQKIEELTLYTIEQEKKLSLQEEKLREQAVSIMEFDEMKKEMILIKSMITKLDKY